jgi:hypothetical protein
MNWIKKFLDYDERIIKIEADIADIREAYRAQLTQINIIRKDSLSRSSLRWLEEDLEEHKEETKKLCQETKNDCRKEISYLFGFHPGKLGKTFNWTPEKLTMTIKKVRYDLQKLGQRFDYFKNKSKAA